MVGSSWWSLVGCGGMWWGLGYGGVGCGGMWCGGVWWGVVGVVGVVGCGGVWCSVVGCVGVWWGVVGCGGVWWGVVRLVRVRLSHHETLKKHHKLSNKDTISLSDLPQVGTPHLNQVLKPIL